MTREWLLMTKETRRKYASATWLPLRVAQREGNNLDIHQIGYVEAGLFGGSVAIGPKNEEVGEKLGWSDIGIGHSVLPYAYNDYYSPIDEYQYNDRQPIGVELVFEHPQPVVGGTLWVVNPDLVVALRLVKEGNQWLRPEENFLPVIRESFGEDGRHTLIEIKREFLLDYLAARNLSLRMAYYMQRIENVFSLEGTDYDGLATTSASRDGGRFELRVSKIDDVFGGAWSVFKMWRTDVDDEADAPVLGPETNDNVGHEQSEGTRSGFSGIRLESEFWGEEWIRHAGISSRVRGDEESSLPDYIVDTDGSRLPSKALNDEEIGRWLWFRSQVVNELTALRGFSLEWYTRDTGGIASTSGCSAHFGVNSLGYLTVYAQDIARLPGWEQRIWAAHNVAPDGKVSKELLDAQVRTEPASTTAPEKKLLEIMGALEEAFERKYDITLFHGPIDLHIYYRRVSRFSSTDLSSLLTLAKELVRVFSDRLDVRALRTLSYREGKEKLGSNKLLEGILADIVGEERARQSFGPIFGAYDMRVGDAHPTGSRIADAVRLVGVDESAPFVQQGQQLIENFAGALFEIGSGMFGSGTGSAPQS